MTEERVSTGYVARPQFVPLHKRKARWAALVCHRRAGKTVATLNDLIDHALRCDKPDPRFAYLAPTYQQAKDVAWTYLTRFTANVPGVQYQIAELRVDFPHNGARIRLYGAENYDRLRGLYLDGIVIDEFGDIDPRAWTEVIRPALSDRQGWATFIGTPKGRNHFAQVWDDAGTDPAWFRMMLKASETGIIDKAELDDARRGMTEDAYNQEYECSFDAATIGAYYGKDMALAESDKRICSVPYDRTAPVVTAWDLGMDDSTAIWFAQVVGKEIRIIDYYEASGEALSHYADVLKSKPYSYGEHFLPHDVEVKELGSGRTRSETLMSLGVKPSPGRPRDPEDRINAVRMILSRCWFDHIKTKRGIECLRNYRRDWDEKTKSFRTKPKHDWSSHAADAFGELAFGLRTEKPKSWGQPSTKWVV